MAYIPDSPYPAPVFLARNQTTTGVQNNNILDVSMCTTSRIPPVIIGTVVGDLTVVIEGSHDAENWADFSSGGFTADFAKDLIQGIRFWRTRVTTYDSGSFNASVGAVSDMEGRVVMPNLKTVTNNVPTTAGG